MNETKALLSLVQAFFQDYLVGQRGLSPNTILAYRDALKLFLAFLARSSGRPAVQLRLEDLKAERVLAFLEDVEQKRNNCTATRNLRLAALRTFFQYMISEDTVRSGQYQKIVAIPVKRNPRPVMGYLDIAEVQAILDSIDRDSSAGSRDYALFSFLYNTGARVQEVVDATVGAVRFSTPPIVTLTGKGSKTRIVPLWQTTATTLLGHLKQRGIEKQQDARLFVNARGEPLTRFGVRHILRARHHCHRTAANDSARPAEHCPGIAPGSRPLRRASRTLQGRVCESFFSPILPRGGYRTYPAGVRVLKQGAICTLIRHSKGRGCYRL